MERCGAYQIEDPYERKGRLILIALSSSAATNELAAAALHQLPNLKGCDVHSTVLLSGVDTGTLNRLGMYLTCDPVYEEEDRKYHKQ